MPESLTLSSLPLFPLATVLYPGGILSLRIFEVRYLDMIGKCQKAGAPFGVVCLTEGSEVRKLDASTGDGNGFAKENFHSVGTLATITAFSAPQSGLMVIRCEGTQRFEINRREKLGHGLWIADVRHLPSDKEVKVPEDLEPAANALGKLINNLRKHERLDEPMPLVHPRNLDDCGWVANRWCELLPIPTELKQQLMQLDNPLLRLELVSDILQRTGISL